MPIEVETPDGIAEFPDGTSPETIKLALRRRYAVNRDLYSTNPTEGMSGPQRFAAGAGKAVADIGRGAGQMLGLVDEQAVAESRRRDAPLMETGAGVAGNIAGNVASFLPASMIPGANTYTGAALGGALMGALQPTTEDDSRLGNMAIGGGMGVVGQAGANALSRVLSPRTAPAVRELMDEGISPTPGQMLGPTAAKMESGLESIPFVGPTITRGKAKVTEQFNKAAINRALAPIGREAVRTGREGIDDAFNAVSDAYTSAIAKAPQIVPDLQIDLDLVAARQAAQELSPDIATQLDRILTNRVEGKIAQNISGDQFKSIHSDILRLARQYRPSPDPDQRAMAGILDDVAGNLSNLVARNSPDAAKELKQADTAYASLLRVARASLGGEDGVFTPAQLSSAVRGMDRSSNKTQFARGNALMQDLSDSGRSVLGQNMANSGTADRLMIAEALRGRVSPGALLGAVGTGGAYTDVGRRAVAAALAKRPDLVRKAGDYVRLAAPSASAAASAWALQK